MKKTEKAKPETPLWQKILLLGLGIILLVFIEIIFQIINVSDRFKEDDPFVGFENIYPLFGEQKLSDGTIVYRTNENKLSFFNDQQFLKDKPESLFRIFCFGGSTTYGRPYAAQTAFPHWLEINLNLADSTRRYEVINCGGISYASYRIVNLVKEALKYQPDAFVIYSGHNEFLEARTYENILKQNERLKSLRKFLDRFQTYRLMRKAIKEVKEKTKRSKTQLKDEVAAILDASAGLERYTRESIQKEQTINHFRYNIEKIVQISKANKIPIILCTVASNLKDFSPFKSQHKSGLTREQLIDFDSKFKKGCDLQEKGDYKAALVQFYECFSLDNEYAELSYRIARCLYATEQYELAKKYFTMALELDVCPLRAPKGMNIAIRNISKINQVPLVDIETFFSKRAIHEIPGKEFFIDHVHPTIRSHQLIAEQIAQKLWNENIVPRARKVDPAKLKDVYQSEISKLPREYFKKGILNLAKVLGWAGKEKEKFELLSRNAADFQNNFEYFYMLGNSAVKNGELDRAIDYFKKAITLNPSFSESYTNLGFALENSGFPKDALENYHKALQLDPKDYVSQSNIARIYYIMNDLEKAKENYKKAIKIKQDYPHAHEGLGVIYHKLGNFQRAIEEFRLAISYDPNYAEAYYDLGLLYFETYKTDSAIVYFKKAIECNPNYSQAYSSLGVSYYRKKMLKEAIENLETAVSLNPNLAKAHNNLAVAYHSAGKIELAYQHLKKAKDMGYQVHPDFIKMVESELRKKSSN